MNLATCLNIQAQLDENGPPPQVSEALRQVLKATHDGLRPAADLLSYVQDWISRSQQQDRYGK